MLEALIDGAVLQGRQDLHNQLAEQFAFPAWYGKNLDALFDCLSEPGEEMVLRLQNVQLIKDCLGDYAQAFMQVLADAQLENSDFHFEIVDGNSGDGH